MIKKTTLILLCVSILVLLPVYSATSSSQSINGPIEWNQYLNGPDHIGYYNGTGPTSNYTNKSASLSEYVGSPYFPVAESPVVDSENIYVTTNPSTSDVKKMKAFDKNTLKLQWEYEFDADMTVVFAPVLYKDSVIASGSKWHHVGSPTETTYGKIVALYKNSGKVKWTYIEQLNTVEPLTLDGDIVYFATVGYFYRDAGYFAYALNADTGKVIWRGELSYGSTETDPSTSKGYVFFPQRDGTLTAFKKGSEKTSLLGRYPKPEKVWEVKLDDNPLMADKFSPAVAVNGYVLITTYKGVLFCLNEKTGAIEWQKSDLGEQTYWSGAVYGNKFILGTTRGTIFWYDIKDGKVLYSVKVNETLKENSTVTFSTTPIATNNGFYIGGTYNGSGTIFCFDYNNTLVWKNKTRGGVSKVGAFSEGKLYSVTFNGWLTVFDGVRESKTDTPMIFDPQALPILFVMVIAIVVAAYYIIKRVRGLKIC
jgi:outer membrane protein assembly factor BamB